MKPANTACTGENHPGTHLHLRQVQVSQPTPGKVRRGHNGGTAASRRARFQAVSTA
jgi:hypothetical protein